MCINFFLQNTGIECVNKFYIKSFFNNQIDGQQLLKISYSELIELVRNRNKLMS